MCVATGAADMLTKLSESRPALPTTLTADQEIATLALSEIAAQKHAAKEDLESRNGAAKELAAAAQATRMLKEDQPEARRRNQDHVLVPTATAPLAEQAATGAAPSERRDKSSPPAFGPANRMR